MNRDSLAPPRRRARLRGSSGQATVELALILPILMIVTVALVELARAWNHYQVIVDAAREGARNAVIADEDMTEAQIFARIEERLSSAGISGTGLVKDADGACGEVGAAGTVVEIYGCGWDGGRGDAVTVMIRAPYRFAILGNFLNWTTGQRTIPLYSRAIMRKE